MPPLTPWPVHESCQFLRPSSGSHLRVQPPDEQKNNQKNSGAAMQQNRSQVTERDGLFELEAGSDVLDSPRYNHDMAPTKVRERTWNKWHITALWVGMSICVPTYTLGGVLTAYFGLTVGEALLAILFANVIVLIPLTLNAFPGTKYGIPFPVLLRSSFGVLGSNIPCLIRALDRKSVV